MIDWLIDWLNNFQNSGNILLHFGKESLYIFKLCACRRTRIDQKQYAWRLQYNFRSIIFFKSGFLSQNIGWSVVFIFLLKKKILKKTEYWQRNRGFTFSPEVKVYPLIDSPMMLCNQPRRLSRDYTDVKNWLLIYSVDQPPSIFLCVILLDMNKPRPWQCPWTSAKRRKKRTKNGNTAMSEQAIEDQACKRSSRELRKAL